MHDVIRVALDYVYPDGLYIYSQPQQKEINL